MKNSNLAFILFAICAMALSSCSRGGYGCGYSSTELKEIKPTVALQQNDTPEVKEHAICSTELIEITE